MHIILIQPNEQTKTLHVLAKLSAQHVLQGKVMNSYNVIFKGEIAEGKDRHKLSQALAKFLKVPEANAHVLFSGKPICIKKALPEDEALAIKAKLNTAGIITYIKQSTIQQATTTPVATTPKKVVKSTIEPVQHAKPTTKSNNDLSIGWQEVFAVFDEFQADKLGYWGALRSPELAAKSPKEIRKAQNTAGFNGLAFIFGSFYYIYKGMWKKAIYLFLFLMLLNVTILTLASFITDKDLSKLPLLINSVIYALTANYDYYRYYKLGETTWSWIPKWMSGWLGLTSTAAIAISIALIITYIRIADPLNVAFVKESYLEDYRQTTIGQAFDTWASCISTSWVEQQASNGVITVVYTCHMKLKDFKRISKKASEAITGKVDETFSSAITRASLKIHFLINLDDTFEVNNARWQLSFGKEKQYSPYITATNALDDIFSNSLNKAIGEIFTPQNVLINQVTK
jgi:hypothetical protein